MIHLVDRFVFQSVAYHSEIPTSAGLFGGYPPAVRPGVRLVKSNVAHMFEGGAEIPMSTESLVEQSNQNLVHGDLRVGSGIRKSETYDRGDMFLGLSPGGAGYGDVLDRDPDLVMSDVRRRIISPWVAENVCKVAFDPLSLQPETAETDRMREEERAARLSRGLTYDDFMQEWEKLAPNPEILEYFGAWPSGEPTREIVRI